MFAWHDISFLSQIPTQQLATWLWFPHVFLADLMLSYSSWLNHDYQPYVTLPHTFFWDQVYPGELFLILKIALIICVTDVSTSIPCLFFFFRNCLLYPSGKHSVLPMQSYLSCYSTLLFLLFRGLTVLPYSCERGMWE